MGEMRKGRQIYILSKITRVVSTGRSKGYLKNRSRRRLRASKNNWSGKTKLQYSFFFFFFYRFFLLNNHIDINNSEIVMNTLHWRIILRRSTTDQSRKFMIQQSTNHVRPWFKIPPITWVLQATTDQSGVAASESTHLTVLAWQNYKPHFSS